MSRAFSSSHTDVCGVRQGRTEGSRPTHRVEWFKLFLDPAVLREGRLASSARLPDLPPGKEPIDVITDYLSCLWLYAKERITEEIGSVADLGESVPARRITLSCLSPRTKNAQGGRGDHAGELTIETLAQRPPTLSSRSRRLGTRRVAS